MGPRCHYYDHPILWNDDRKRWEERKIAQESLIDWNRRKEFQRVKAARDREQYRRMIIEHNPWGKPGGGAPNNDIRMSNIVSKYGLYPDGREDCRNVPPAFRYRPPRGHGGGGAPIRSASGRLLVPYRDDPILGFNDPTRNYVDIELRYKASAKKKNNYKMQLDTLIAEKEKDLQRKKNNSLEVDKTLDAMREPWGRPGPGGNPWRPARLVGNKFLQSLGWTNKADLQNLDYEPCINHPEKPSKPPKLNNIREEKNINMCRNHPEKEMNVKNKNFTTGNENKCCTKCVCVCLKEIMSKENINNEDRPRPVNQQQFAKQLQDPNNIPAAGIAVITGAAANPDQQKYKLPKRANTNIYLKHRSKNCIVEPKARPCMITGGVELVPLLAKRRVQQDQRPISLSTTDVTRYKDGKGDWKEYGVQYLDELNRQISRKERNQRMLKDRDVLTSKLHFDTWDTFWGRPGHGAPRPIKNKLNLNDLLYNVPLK